MNEDKFKLYKRIRFVEVLVASTNTNFVSGNVQSSLDAV